MFACAASGNGANLTNPANPYRPPNTTVTAC